MLEKRREVFFLLHHLSRKEERDQKRKRIASTGFDSVT